jgi:hypothetical protein
MSRATRLGLMVGLIRIFMSTRIRFRSWTSLVWRRGRFFRLKQRQHATSRNTNRPSMITTHGGSPSWLAISCGW